MGIANAFETEAQRQAHLAACRAAAERDCPVHTPADQQEAGVEDAEFRVLDENTAPQIEQREKD